MAELDDLLIQLIGAGESDESDDIYNNNNDDNNNNDSSTKKPSSSSMFAFLVGCYKRCTTTQIPTHLETNEDAKTCLATLRRSLVSYAGLTLMPSPMFSDETRRNGVRDLHRMLGADASISRALPDGFLHELAEVYSDDADLIDVLFQPIVAYAKDYINVATRVVRDQQQRAQQQQQEAIQPSASQSSNSSSAESATNVLIEQSRKPLRAALALCRVKSLAQRFVRLDAFLGDYKFGRQVQNFSLLGALMGVAVDYTDPRLSNIHQRGFADVRSSVARIRTSMARTQRHIVDLIGVLVRKSGETSRNAVLAWTARLLRLSQNRVKMRYDATWEASHDLFAHLSLAFLDLCQPIMARSKFDKVDPRFAALPLLDAATVAADVERKPWHADYSAYFGDVTRLYASNAELAERLASSSAATDVVKFNFMSECFFATHQILHVGLIRAIRESKHAMRNIQERSDYVRHLEQQQSRGANVAMVIRQQSAVISRMLAQVCGMQVHLLNPDFVRSAGAFYNWTAQWLLALNERTDDEEEKSQPRSAALECVPEFIVEDIIEFYLFVADQDRGLLSSLSCDAVLDMLVVLIAGPLAIKNPHLRGEFAQLLTIWLPPTTADVDLSPVLRTHKTLPTTLVPALLELYVEIEHGENQFYGKFNTRNVLNRVFKYLWSVPVYRDAFVAAMRDHDRFLRFTNCLCNDMIYLLDESLKSLTEIRSMQLAMADQQQWGRLSNEERQRQQRSFQGTERQARSLMLLATSTVDMLYYMSDVENGGFVAPFVLPEVVERMAHMVDFFINRLSGDQVAQLKVENREKYSFHPRRLLRQILGIFLHLAVDDAFLQAVAGDQRSYSIKVFSKAAKTAEKHSLLTSAQLDAFAHALDKVQAFAANAEDLEEKLGDIPDEFQDALMYTLMRDPVILPGCNQRMDRANILRHLLNEETNPFTRQPLKADMLEPDDQLRQRIEQWIEEKLKNNSC
eukprot:TRINITY_DN65718_c11_g5_i1.p1 TRINITY_DN65718_c11_g5~~TRINITY_DN65718_c11_g5_i1.p1  ORF type:complete len:987 (-),score=537.28 TRINITY_DN65718_c11_g5_i1:27-2936(-)